MKREYFSNKHSFLLSPWELAQLSSQMHTHEGKIIFIKSKKRTVFRIHKNKARAVDLYDILSRKTNVKEQKKRTLEQKIHY